MILLLGGTSETASLAGAMAGAGHAVLVSTATDEPLALPAHVRVRRRSGPLDAAGMRALIREVRAGALVDAAHPYAAGAHANARTAAGAEGIPYLRWLRAGTEAEAAGGVIRAEGHEEAARAAFSLGRPVLLTTGSRHLDPYVRAARETGLRLTVRVLPRADSLAACRLAGLSGGEIVAARGPFSVEENRRAIRAAGAGVLVTKDSGAEGGVPAKLEAARREACRVVLIERPAVAVPGGFSSLEALLGALPAPGRAATGED